MEKLRTVLKKVKCKQCNTKCEVLEVVGKGKTIKYAPCKNCGCENTISSEKWQRGPAEVDLLVDAEVIQYIRDLLNLADLLERGLDPELLIFIKKLKSAGHLDDQIHRYITLAGYGTRYESLTDRYGDKIVPRAIPSKGDRKEWLKLKSRSI